MRSDSWVDTLYNASLRMAESGLAVAATAVETLQGVAGALSEDPDDGATRADIATSDFSNRILRAWRSKTAAPRSFEDLLRELSELGRAAMEKASPGIAERPREWPALALRLPLSGMSLLVQELQRLLPLLEVLPPARLPDFLSFVTETFGDLDTYFRLRYPEEIERLERRLRDFPGDADARLELGWIYLKCGLLTEAVRELDYAAVAPSLRQQALFAASVACYRSGDIEGALERGSECLRLAPDDAQARYWLWLSSRQAGGYPSEVGESLRFEAVDGYGPTWLELEDVAAEIGLDKISGGRGTAVLDVNGNGCLDVVVTGAHAGVGLYRNNGDGTFTDISLGSGLEHCVYGFAVVAGDFDNDGRQDLYITSMGFYDGQGALYRNNGDGTFTDVTQAAGLGGWGPGFTAAWLDTDGNGWLDLFVVHNLGGLFDRKTPNRLYRNNGDGTFTDVTTQAGLETHWPSLGIAWGDFRNNGLPDLFISNLGRAQLYQNNGDGTFTDVSRAAGVDRPAIGSVAFACDIDDDGWLDIVQLTYSRPEAAIETLRTGQGPPGGSPMRVYRNNRDGTFSEIGAELGLTGCWGTMSAAYGDVSNSGRLDLLLGNGDPSMDRLEASVLLEGDGSTFRNTTFAAGLPFAGKGHGVNMADFTSDGRLHLLVAAGGLYPGDLMTTTVFRPRQRTGGYLNVRLVGQVSNRDAMGARLALHAGGRVQHRLVSGGSGFGCLPTEQHFGLGNLEEAEALVVQWPSGIEQRFEKPPVSTTIRIVEGQEGWERVAHG